MNIQELTAEIVEGKGYAILPDLLSRAETLKMRESILAIASRDRENHKLSTKGFKERVYGLIYKDDIFARLVQDELIITIIEAILGQDIILGGFSAHILHPGAQRMGIHVDYPYWAMSSPFPRSPVLEIQVIWAIDDFTAENGAPLFAPHTQNLATKPDTDKFERIAEKLTVTAGTAIISHGLSWHDTSINQSDRPRISLLGNYTPQYIQSLENNLFDFEEETFKKATPQLKKLLRHSWMSKKRQAYEMKFKMME